MEIRIDRLRKDIMDYYGTAAFNGFPMAVVDLGKIERMSDEEIVRLAQEKGIALEKYRV